jgi:hypothetical protein
MIGRSTAAVWAAIAALGLADTGAAHARSRAPVLTGLRCVPASTAACHGAIRLAVGRQIQLRGRGLVRGMRVTFRWPNGALATKLRRSGAGWTAVIPPGTAVGTISVTVRDRAQRRSNVRHISVIAEAPQSPRVATVPGELPDAFRGNGMWIWMLPKSDVGNLDTIAGRARAAGIGTVFVKSADGTSAWSQFTPQLVADLHARGLRACGWQFVYGADPIGEAAAGVGAAQAGADCLVIDAETAYEGRYAAAQRYLAALRATLGPDYPVGFTSFPYVEYHARLPYSVFLGAGGAQANLPQVYWKDIGASVDAVSARTLAENRVYGTPLAPLGQAFSNPDPADLVRFRAIWAGYGAAGLSWWSWQASSDTTWATLSQPPPPPLVLPDPGWPSLRRGSSGDHVVWLQQHLASADPTVAIDGRFTAATQAALIAFQTARGLPPSGESDAATWQAVLALPVVAVDWTAR